MRRTNVCLFRFLYTQNCWRKQRQTEIAWNSIPTEHVLMHAINFTLRLGFSYKSTERGMRLFHDTTKMQICHCHDSGQTLGMWFSFDQFGWSWLFCSLLFFLLFNSIFDINLWWRVVCRIYLAAFSAAQSKMQTPNQAWHWSSRIDDCNWGKIYRMNRNAALLNV